MTPLEEKAKQDAKDIMSELHGEAVMAVIDGEMDEASILEVLEDACLCIRAEEQKKIEDVAVTGLAQAIRDAVSEEREANCKEICGACAEGWPIDDEGLHTNPEGETANLPFYQCDAQAIRNRGDGKE